MERLAVANDHTEIRRIGDMLAVLGDGNDVAIVTDAGTPGISDPGERLVRAALDAGYAVSAVPGPGCGDHGVNDQWVADGAVRV